jgi:hypothetical protein
MRLRRSPEQQLVMIGEVGRIDPTMQPMHPAIHRRDLELYKDLPLHRAGWEEFVDQCAAPREAQRPARWPATADGALGQTPRDLTKLGDAS